MKTAISIGICSAMIASACAAENEPSKDVIYQMLPRVFANENTTNIEWGSIEQNGVGKLNDITSEALEAIRADGATYVWYTGIPHHAITNDYTEFGISLDDPDVIKGRAGSPYAVKDYYNINPDLAVNVDNRLAEFEALIERTHRADLKVIIDIVPNHVARNYQSTSAPEGISDLGEDDDTSVQYARDNNFYYNPGEAFTLPEWPSNYQVMGGVADTRVDGRYSETPARWTGNGSRESQPAFFDWYETIKINFGVKPNGSYDFASLSAEVIAGGCQTMHAFWQTQSVPDSWLKFEEIAHYWLKKGVDGFRFDMAEMVPVEFWSYLNCSIKAEYPDTFLLAEVYQPDLYRDYIHIGQMTALYDKVGFYDALKRVMQGSGTVSSVITEFESVADIQSQMLHFLENHDEQRLAHPDFAGDALIGRPAMAVSTLISSSPTLVYFGQSLGESAPDDAGFGTASRTTIFDYWGLDTIARWRNGGAYDCGQCSKEESSLHHFYQELMNLSAHPVFEGETVDLHQYNLDLDSHYSERHWAFLRTDSTTTVLVIANFDATDTDLDIYLPDTYRLSSNSKTLLGQHRAIPTKHGLKVTVEANNVVVIEL